MKTLGQEYSGVACSYLSASGRSEYLVQPVLYRLRRNAGRRTVHVHYMSSLYKTKIFTLLIDLGQEAHAIRSLAPLPLDENFGDTRQMLARMAILSNEMLISIELHLSRGLMSKRLEIKVKISLLRQQNMVRVVFPKILTKFGALKKRFPWNINCRNIWF